MKYKLFVIFLVAFFVGFTFLYFEGTKIKYLSVFLPHREKHIILQPSKESGKINPIFYGVNVDMSQLVPGTAGYVVNSKGDDLTDIAGKLGINLFRITSTNKINGAFTYTKRQWDLVLNKMSKANIKALILVESPTLNPSDYGSTYLNLVKSYVLDPGVLNNPNVYAIDIRNEPLLTDGNISAMVKAAKMIKDANPKVLITVGGWKSYNPNETPISTDPFIWMDPKAGKRLSSFIDFYSIHTYEYDKSFLGVYPDGYNLTEYSINKVLPVLNDKPILIEEFGAGNGEAITDQQTLGSPELQANAYDGAYQAIIDYHPQGILGSVAFLFMQRNQPTEAGWAIAKDNGNYLFPAAYVLQKYSLGKSDVTLDLPYASIPTDYLLSNSDNNNSINVKVNDIIGLRLSLSKEYTNIVKVSNPAILLKSEPFVRENNGDYIDAVFHVTKKGASFIKIIGSSTRGVVTRFSVSINAGD